MTKTTSSHHTASLPTGTCLWPCNTCCSSLSNGICCFKYIFENDFSHPSIWTIFILTFYPPLNILCFRFPPKYGFLFTSKHAVLWVPTKIRLFIHFWTFCALGSNSSMVLYPPLSPNSPPSRLTALIPVLLALLDTQSALNLNQFHQCHYSIPISWNKSGISLQDKLCYDLLPCTTSNRLWKQPIEHFIWARLTNL